MKKPLSYLWKLPLCGIAFFVGLTVSGVALPYLGFQSPEMPEGTDANTIALWFLLGSMLLAFVMSFISRNLQTNWLTRWIILVELVWVFGVVGMVIESFFFMTTGVVASLINALFTTLNFLLPSLFLAVLVTALFRPVVPFEPCISCLRNYFATHKTFAWGWRFVAALLAYPLVYFTFGIMVQPFIQGFYSAGQFELTIPGWNVLIPLQLFRSLLFLMASLPVIIWWRGSQRGLWLSLGFSVFTLTAFMAVITSYWFPWQLRLFHGLELLADALVYTGGLVILLGRMQVTKSEREKFDLPDLLVESSRF